MKTRQNILPAVCCISLLSACASNQTIGIAPESIKTINPIADINAKQKPESVYQIGRYYQGQNRYEQAIAAYQKALAIDNHFVEARNGLGVIFSRQGKYNEAIAAFKLAIQQAPQASHLYSNMGYAYYLQGQYADSVTALVQATSLDPNNQHALNNLGLAYAKAGNPVKSMQTFSQVATQQTLAITSVQVPTKVSTQTSQEVSPEVWSTVIAPALAQVNAAVISKVETQSLALPKDRGAIRLMAKTLPIVESRSRLVPLKANVSELQMQSYEVTTSGIPKRYALDPVTDNHNAAKLKLEVANGNGVAGMAGKVGQFLHGQGYAKPRLTNHKSFQVRMTQIQYREAYQAEAQLLQASLTEAAILIKQNNMRADIGIRLLLGKDVATHTAYFEEKTASPLVALN